jgi:flagellar protein FliL
MKKNNLLIKMAIILVVIALIGAIALVYVLNTTGPEKEKKIDEVLKASVDIPEITTNLASDDFIRISFKIQTDSKKAKKELEKRMFQVNNIMILELSEKTAENLSGKEGQLQLEEQLKTKINEIMQEGKIEKVYITQFILQ